jgi:hypothetical protein
LRAEVDSASADGVEHDRGDLRIGVLTRVVLGPLPHVGIGAPRVLDEKLELLLVAGVIGHVLPVALFETENAEPRLRHVLRDHCPRSAGADDEDVHGLRRDRRRRR